MMTDITNKSRLEFTTEQDQGGRGAWFEGRFLYWGATLSRPLIAVRRLQQKIDRGVVLAVWAVAAIGVLAFFYWLYLNQSALRNRPWRLLFFWREPDPLILLFLLAIGGGLFLVYKHSQAAAARQKINYRHWPKEGQAASLRQKRLPKRYDVAAALSDNLVRAVEEAYSLARRLKQPAVTPAHLLRALLSFTEVQNLFIRLHVDAEKMIGLVDRQLVREPAISAGEATVMSETSQEIMVLAFRDAFSERQPSVDLLNVCLFIYEQDAVLKEVFHELELDQEKIANTVAWFRVNRRLVERYRKYRHLAGLKPGDNMNRAYTAVATPTLDHFSHDLTIRAKFGGLDICVGREREIEAIFEAFTGGHHGVLLVGPNGVGKKTIIGGLAQLMVAEDVPDFLKDRRLVELDIPRLVAGSAPGQAEERLLVSLNEVSRSGNIILYISNLENIIGISSGSQESLDLSEVLADALVRRNIYCVATATADNYSRYIESKAIGQVMTTIGVKEPSISQAIRILESKVGFMEAKYDIFMIYSALEQAVTLSARYLHDKFLPAKAIGLLEKAAILAAKQAREKGAAGFCGQQEVALALGEMTGIPVSRVTASESEKLLHLESEIHKRLVGQVEAVAAVAASLRRARTELKDAKRPIASFLFLGPTGVGKTELAKAVSQIYFGDEDYLIRIDMSEYQSVDSVRKMIGDVDGTLGYLTEAVRKKPFSLILFDEIEKANPDILNLFLQLLDDGRLTDGQGRTISFSESIIIATSNIGAVYIQDQIKAKTPLDRIKQELIDEQLNKYLRPELINRFDGIIVFKPLGEEEIFSIATLMLRRIKKSLLDKGISLKADKDGVRKLAKLGHDPKFGARPLRRLLQEKVENEIANRLLSGDLKRRDTVIITSRATIEVEKGAEL